MELELAQLPAIERYKLLIGLVIPRPIAWVSTLSENGVANCAPFSFFNVISEEPPLCIISFNWRSDGELKHTLKNIRRTKEFVVNLADEGTANAMQAHNAIQVKILFIAVFPDWLERLRAQVPAASSRRQKLGI